MSNTATVAAPAGTTDPAPGDNSATDTDTAHSIDARDDDFTAVPVNAASGGSIPSVLVNDLLNGAAVDGALITLTPGTAPAPAAGSITMNADGTITVAAGTAAGTYSFVYTICDVLNPANCDTANVLVAVIDPAAPVAELVTDISRGNTFGLPVTLKVLRNDRDPSTFLDAATLEILGSSGPGAPLEVPGEGVWSVNLRVGTITFTPGAEFRGDPTPIPYRLRDRSGTLMQPALVIITYAADPAFVCADVIGKVFDDANRDGHQDPDEAGIPAVRLVTVKGTIITADMHGRFSVPCAEFPQDIGSTFLLKLDPRSLPTGYQLTTENPQTVRLTPGMMSKMNFGVALTDVVRVDLSAKAFDPKTGAIGRELDKGTGGACQATGAEPLVRAGDILRRGRDDASGRAQASAGRKPPARTVAPKQQGQARR